MTIKQLGKRVAHWQDILCLGNWEFDVCIVDELGEDSEYRAVASVDAMDDYDTATIKFLRDWLDNADEQDIDRKIVHELMHVLFRNYDHAVQSIRSQVGGQAAYVWGDRLDHEEEWLVETLARILVHLHG